jgi:peptidoglycan/LPS O-acetylase OafA/YrhL
MQPASARLTTRAHLAPLTGLRFFAAFNVLLYHTAPRPAPGSTIALGLLNSGYVGVGLFYVLSGFILSYNYLDAAIEGRLDRRSYLAARFARVYPVYAFALLLALPIFAQWVVQKVGGEGVHGAAKVAASAIANIALLQSWFPITIPQWNAPGWSLSNEAIFYLCFPALARWVGRLGARGIARTLPLLWIAALAVPLIYVLTYPVIGPNDFRGSTNLGDVVDFNPLLRLPEFVIGMLLGRSFLARTAEAATRQARLSGVVATIALALILVTLALSAWLPRPVLHNGLLAPLFAALIFALAAGGGVLGRLLGTAPVVRLGEASYSLYLMHIPLYVYAGWIAAPRGFDTSHPIAFFVGYVVVTIAMALAVLRFVEEPARRAIRRRLSRELTPRDRALVVSEVPADA